jgi:hypothetical protein
MNSMSVPKRICWQTPGKWGIRCIYKDGEWVPYKSVDELTDELKKVTISSPSKKIKKVIKKSSYKRKEKITRLN